MPERERRRVRAARAHARGAGLALAEALLDDPDDAADAVQDAVVGVRISTAMIMSGAAEILCYGTAVVCEDG